MHSMKVICLLPPGPLPPIIPPFPEHWQRETIHQTSGLTEEVVAGAEAMLMAVHTPLGAAELDRLPALKLVQWVGVGVDCIDLEAARQRSIPVANVYAANAVSVAEYVIMATVHLLRRIGEVIEEGRQGRFPWPGFIARGLYEVRGKTMGILGYGAIGHEVAVRARAMGMRILAASIPGRERQPSPAEIDVGAVRVDFEELLATTDVLTLHTPLDDNTRGLFDEATLRRMKPGSALINSARGGIVDEEAVARFLHDGHLGGAAIDTFEVEPIRADHPLWKAPNALLTPHCAGNTLECTRYVAQESFENINRVLRGDEPKYRIC